MIEKKATIEEDSFKKRIKMHEDFSKEQEQKMWEKEVTFKKDLEEVKRQYDIEVYQVTKQRDELKEKCSYLER